MAARSIASGTISFGLVAIPVKLYSTGESSSDVRFNMVHKSCGTRLQYRYYCPTDDVYVERDDVAKGYEVSKGQYVLFSPDELKALNPEPTHEMQITEFVPLEKVDPIYYEKSYYLGPDKGGARPYRLLSQAMRESGRAALGRYAARGKTYLVLLRPFEDGLLMQQLHYAEELKPWTEVPVADAELKKGELELALQLIDNLAAERFDPEQYQDEGKDRVRALIERKIQGEELVAAPEAAPKAQVVDLMAALKASLGGAGEAPAKPARKAAKRSPKKPAAAKKAPARKRAKAKAGGSE